MRGQQTEADRIAELRDDPQCKQFDAHRCLCASCGRWVHLSGRAHKIFNWRRHKKGCTPQKARGGITIIHTKSQSNEGDDLDDGMDETYSTYSASNSDDGHSDPRGYYDYRLADRERHLSLNGSNLKLPSISTFSLSNSPDLTTPPLSSSGVSTASDSIRSFNTHHRGISSTSVNSLPPHNHHHHHHHHPHPYQTHSKSKTYDSPFASRVQCELCSKNVDLVEYPAHKRLCRTRASTSNLYERSQLLTVPKTSSHANNQLPPLSSIPPMDNHRAFAFPTRDLPPLPRINTFVPHGLHSDLHQTQHARSADPLRRPPRSIADLCNPSSSAAPVSASADLSRHHYYRTSSSRSESRSANTTPIPHAAKLEASYVCSRSTVEPEDDDDLRDTPGHMSWSNTQCLPSPSPSPPPSYTYNGSYSRNQMRRSISPPSPFASDSEA